MLWQYICNIRYWYVNTGAKSVIRTAWSPAEYDCHQYQWRWVLPADSLMNCMYPLPSNTHRPQTLNLNFLWAAAAISLSAILSESWIMVQYAGQVMSPCSNKRSDSSKEATGSTHVPKRTGLDTIHCHLPMVFPDFLPYTTHHSLETTAAGSISASTFWWVRNTENCTNSLIPPTPLYSQVICETNWPKRQQRIIAELQTILQENTVCANPPSP